MKSRSVERRTKFHPTPGSIERGLYFLSAGHKTAIKDVTTVSHKRALKATVEQLSWIHRENSHLLAGPFTSYLMGHLNLTGWAIYILLSGPFKYFSLGHLQLTGWAIYNSSTAVVKFWLFTGLSSVTHLY